MNIFKKMHVCSNNGCALHFGLKQISIIQGTNTEFAGRVLKLSKTGHPHTITMPKLTPNLILNKKTSWACATAK
jgi:hypothetical protein